MEKSELAERGCFRRRVATFFLWTARIWSRSLATTQMVFDGAVAGVYCYRSVATFTPLRRRYEATSTNPVQARSCICRTVNWFKRTLQEGSPRYGAAPKGVPGRGWPSADVAVALHVFAPTPCFFPQRSFYGSGPKRDL